MNKRVFGEVLPKIIGARSLGVLEEGKSMYIQRKTEVLKELSGEFAEYPPGKVGIAAILSIIIDKIRMVIIVTIFGKRERNFIIGFLQSILTALDLGGILTLSIHRLSRKFRGLCRSHSSGFTTGKQPSFILFAAARPPDRQRSTLSMSGLFEHYQQPAFNTGCHEDQYVRKRLLQDYSRVRKQVFLPVTARVPKIKTLLT